MAPKEEASAAAAMEAPKMAPKQEEEAHLVKPNIQTFKYSKRVVMETLLSREDRGVGLVGEKIVIGGWVKSSKEVRKPPPLPQPDTQPPQPGAKTGQKDVTCTEILQNRMPIFRTFLKLFGVGNHAEKDSAGGLVQRMKHPVVSTVFLRISDGSCIDSLQVVVDSTLAPPGQILLSGTCILVEGVIQLPSDDGKHSIEIKAEKVLHLGVVEDHEKYPLSKKRLPLHTLRDWAHFRPRTTTVASITRIRHSLTHATHNFFQNNGFLYVQVPVITTTDTEGLGNKFNVTTFLSKTTEESPNKPSATNEVSGISLTVIKASLKEKSNQVEELKRTDSNREALLAAIQDLKKTNELASQLEAKEKREKVKATTTTAVKPNRLDFTDDFFSCQAFLTVSGRLHLESYACALGNVYSFGPRFKAQTSHSTRHVSEMWMVEAEMAFAELEEAMCSATDFLKHLCKWVLENCKEDMKFLLKRVDQNIVDRLKSVVSINFEKIPYCQAVDVLKQVKEKKFEFNIEWGVPLTEEHESYLADEIYKKPVIIYDYPKEVKPFYVRQNDDGKTVAAFDVIVPKVGAVIRGSQNEERVHVLSTRIKELGLSIEQYEWYLDLRRQGTAKHAGFSLTFDLVVLLATGISDIRDVIPFPRSYGKLSN